MQSISGSNGTMPDLASITERRAQLFAKADADGNGKITFAEFKSAAPPGGPPQGGGQGNVGGPSGARGVDRANGPPPLGGKGKLDMESMFSAMDTDQDGSVSSEEHAAFEPQMATHTLGAMLSFQDVGLDIGSDVASANGSSRNSVKTATMADILSQLHSLLEQSTDKGKSNWSHAIRA